MIIALDVVWSMDHGDAVQVRWRHAGRLRGITCPKRLLGVAFVAPQCMSFPQAGGWAI